MKIGLSLAYGAALTMCGLCRAHHAPAQFDLMRLITVEGTVAAFQWTNPHVFIQLWVDDGAGKTTEWSIEAPNPAGLARLGWRSNSLKRGERVAITLNPLRTGGPGGFVQSVRLADGTVLQQTEVQLQRGERAKP